MIQRVFKPGDRVVFCRMKRKTHPSRRARGVQPAANGDDYSYYVEKYWVVSDVFSDGRVELLTPRGKKRVVHADDPGLRHASLKDRILYRTRFQQIDATIASS